MPKGYKILRRKPCLRFYFMLSWLHCYGLEVRLSIMRATTYIRVTVKHVLGAEFYIVR